MRLVLAALILLAVPPLAAQDITSGNALFQRHCSACHGAGARGDGPRAPELNPQPRDLTVLKAGNDGVFPLLAVVKRIDGRDKLVAHGSPMPVFGPFFEGNPALLATETGQPILTTEPVADLVRWLETVQR